MLAFQGNTYTLMELMIISVNSYSIISYYQYTFAVELKKLFAVSKTSSQRCIVRDFLWTLQTHCIKTKQPVFLHSNYSRNANIIF